jgi:transforming growth factor-beta-induced protein
VGSRAKSEKPAGAELDGSSSLWAQRWSAAVDIAPFRSLRLEPSGGPMTRSRWVLDGALACWLALGIAGCDGSSSPTDAGSDAGPSDPDAGPGEQTIADIATSSPDFSILVAAATRADLVSVLDGDGTFTVFAPTDDAFEASGITLAMIEAMPAEQVAGILTYHALGTERPSSALTAGPTTTLSTFSLIVGTSGGVTLNGGSSVTGGANVVTADIEASNGVIHVIDRVLLPPTVADLARYAGLTSLAGALSAAELADDLAGAGPFTVFAPTNAAFDALTDPPTGPALATVLLYHVVSGAVTSSAVPDRAPSLATNAYGDNLTLLFDTTDGVVVNGGPTVTVADVRGTNGVVHIVDAVITPMNAVDAATAASLTGLLGAVGAAADIPGPPAVSVAAALQADAPYTIFAPTNAAFDAAAATIATLTDEQIRDVLLFHVLDPATFTAPVLAADLPTAVTDVATLNGQSASLDPTADPPTIEGADIVATDIVVTNGVIHLIDAVIVPTL